MVYNWQQKDWLRFQYDEQKVAQTALRFAELAGQSVGYLNGLAERNQADTIVTILVKEAIKTSEIEGEMISRADVISSIRKNLGFETETHVIKDKRSEGIAMLLVKSRENFAADLSQEMLFEWHKMLMRGNHSIIAGEWRTHAEPMQVVSGSIGKEKIHFEAPPSVKVPTEMKAFISWFNASNHDGSSPIENPIIRSAIAHLYFETIHPFEDGNGRIGRVIAEKALAQGLKRPILMSLSTAIEAKKKNYYQALQEGQSGNKINNWIQYFGDMILEAQADFIQSIHFLLKKTAFLDAQKSKLNESQLKVIYRMLNEGEEAFLGGMNARKYQSISHVSKATATRHLQDLVDKKILVATGNGRNVNYQVNLEMH